jgi:hypothetical protein
MFEAIEATDWAAIPGPADIYAPREIAASLRALALAADEASACAATQPLVCGGLSHYHSGCVHPASLVAAPILLDIAEHGSLAAFAYACTVLSDALTGSPWAEDSEDPLLCCAVAELVRARAAMLVARSGQPERYLLKEANAHWALTVSEVAPGRPAQHHARARHARRRARPPGRAYAPCELRIPGQPPRQTDACANVVSAPAVPGGEALVRFSFVEAGQIQPGYVLAAPCHDNVF